MQDCSSVANKQSGISIHPSPKSSGTLKNEWVHFVRTHSNNFNPSGRFGIVSLHFQKQVHIEGCRRSLIRGAKLTTWKKHAEVMTRRDQQAVNNNLCLALHSSFFLCSFPNKTKTKSY